MAKKGRELIPTWILFLLGLVLVVTMWLVSSFPLAAFFAFAPLLIIAARAGAPSEMRWGSYDLIWITLAANFVGASGFHSGQLITALLLAVMFTIPFLAGGWLQPKTHPIIGWVATLTLWVGFELAIKVLFHPEQTLFLSDVFRSTGDWVKWESQTGHLGISLWVLSVNAFWAAAFQSTSGGRGIALSGLLVLIAPLILSLVAYSKVPEETIEGEPLAIGCAVIASSLLLFGYLKSKK